MNTVVFYIQKSSVLLWHKDGQNRWYNFIFNMLNHCKPSELFNTLHSTRMAHALPRLWDCHTSKWIQVVDKRFLLQSSGNADQLPPGHKEQSWSSFSLLLFFLIFRYFPFVGYRTNSALGRICCYCFLSGFCSNEGLFFSCCCCFLWNMICKLKAFLTTVLSTPQTQFGK